MVNEAYCRMSGYSVKEVIGMSWTQQIPPGDIERLKEYNRLRMIDPTYAQDKYEFTFYHRNGEIKHSLMSVSIIEGSKKIITSFIDITERKQAEEALRNSEGKYASAFQTSPYAITITDAKDGKFIDTNDAFTSITGFSRAEAMADSSVGLNLWVNIEDRNNVVTELLEGTKVEGKEFQFKKKDGKHITGLFSARIIHLNNKPYILSSINNITERKQAEEKLAASESLFRNLVETMNDGLAMYDTTGLISYANPRLFEMLGYSREEIIGKQWKGLFDPEDQKILTEQMARWKTGQRGTFEIPWLTKDGRTINTTISGSPLHDPAGNLTGSFLVISDITEHRKLVDELYQTTVLLEHAGEKAKVGGWELDVVSGRLLLSKEAARIHEVDFSIEPLSVSRGDEYYSPEVWPVVRNAVQAAIGQGTAYDLEVPFITAKGNHLWVHITGYAVQENGKAVKLRGLFQDITERKQAEEVLKKEQALSTAIIESIPGTFYMLDETGQYVRWNAYQRDEIVGKPEDLVGSTNALGTIHPDDREFIQSKIANVLANGVVETVESRVLLRGGPAARWLVMTGSRMLIDGHPFLVGIGIDITESKRAQEALQKSEKRLREAQEMAHLGFWTWDVKTGEVEWSEEVFKIFSLDPKEFKPQIDSILALSPWPEDHQRDQELIMRAIETRNPGSYEQKFLRQDKSIGHYYSTFQGNYDEKGELISIVGTVLDITERKRAEEQIKDSEKRFRELIESLPQLFWTCRVDGPCDYLSKQWVEFTGIPEAEQLGYRWLEQLHPDDKDRTVSEWMEKVKTGNSFDIEFRIRRNDGVYHWFKTRAVPIQDAEGNIIKWFGSNTDINDILTAEKALREAYDTMERRVAERTEELAKSNNLLAESGRLARVGGWEVDLITGKNYWSETTRIIHEVEPGFDPNLDTAINFYAPGSIPTITSLVDRLIRLGEPFDAELELITAKKNKIWVRALGEAYRENGKIVKIGGVFQDINERKSAEQEMEQLIQNLNAKSALLEAANKELEAFSYSVSHDLRAPLRHISGYAELLTTKFHDALPEKGKHYLDSIASSSHEMGILIDTLLEFSRTGRADMLKSANDMNDMVNEVIKSISAEHSGRLISWNVDKLPIVQCDGQLLKQVWINLLDNSVKFTCTIADTRIDIGVKEEKNEYIFFVRDNGAGFDMQYAQKLFGVFQRLHPTGQFEGSGIGLANVHRIISRHGGRTWAEAEPDKGATFYFSLTK
jgi:PAS domain S-box-containing protein